MVTSSLLTTLETNSHFPRRPSPPFHLFLFPPPSHSNLPFSFSFSFYSCITFHADTIPHLSISHLPKQWTLFHLSLLFTVSSEANHPPKQSLNNHSSTGTDEVSCTFTSFLSGWPINTNIHTSRISRYTCWASYSCSYFLSQYTAKTTNSYSYFIA